MTDFLTRLATRAVDASPQVRPRAVPFAGETSLAEPVPVQGVPGMQGSAPAPLDVPPASPGATPAASSDLALLERARVPSGTDSLRARTRSGPAPDSAHMQEVTSPAPASDARNGQPVAVRTAQRVASSVRTSLASVVVPTPDAAHVRAPEVAFEMTSAAPQRDAQTEIRPAPTNGRSRAAPFSGNSPVAASTAVDARRAEEHNTAPGQTTLGQRSVTPTAPHTARAIDRVGRTPFSAEALAAAGTREPAVVQVTIGRVEIRAVSPHVSATPRPAPPAPQALSLGAYLAARKGRAR